MLCSEISTEVVFACSRWILVNWLSISRSVSYLDVSTALQFILKMNFTKATNVNPLECVGCQDRMVGPICLCPRGHSLCQNCLSQLTAPKKCPLCREAMKDVRNIIVENLFENEVQRRLEQLNVRPVEVQATTATTKVPCRFKSEGCKFILQQQDFEGHVEECLFRDMICPFLIFNGSCLWTNKFGMLKSHFLSLHPDGILVENREYETPDLQNSTGMVRLILLDKLHFVLYWQWSVFKNIHLVAVQSIGTKAYAQNWNYDIKFFKVEEPRRSFSFTDICKSDSVQITEIFQNKHCIVIPKSNFTEFGTRLKFKVVIYKNESTPSKSRPKCSPIASSSLMPVTRE